MKRSDVLTPLRILPKTIDAACYNRVRLALRRIGKPLRFELPNHRGLEVILDDHRWLCVDTLHESRPVLAWMDFQTDNRSALHEPVHCRVHLYHMHAGLVMGTALQDVDRQLETQLARAI